MSSTSLALLLLAGVGAGLTGSIAGLASLVSYPALLAAGLSPIAANIHNTAASLSTGLGTLAGARPELASQGPRVRALMLQCGVGGAVGAALLLNTEEAAFELIVPWLVALGAVLLLVRDPLRVLVAGSRPRPWAARLTVVAVGVYGGYFGAGVGIMLLAVLAARAVEPLAVTNAVKNVASSAAQLVAAAAYVVVMPIDWAVVAALACGSFLGSWVAPPVIRVLPERPLRWAIGAAGLGLAGWLAAG